MIGEKKASTWRKIDEIGDTPVDSLVKPTFAEQCEVVAKCLPPAPFKDCVIALHAEMLEKIESLREDREWQIKQNVKMFTALEQIAKDTIGYGHMGYGQPTAVALVAKAAMVEAGLTA
jgi:hypothetical protein